MVPVPVVIVVLMDVLLMPAGNAARPAKAEAMCMRADVESGDMGSTLE